jgi:hypothetical protein
VSRLSRWAVRGAGAGAALLLVAVVGLNVSLNRQGALRLAREQLTWPHVEYAFAWSVWPGRVHLLGLRLSGQERGVRWEASSTRARAELELGALAERRLHLRSLTVNGLRFRVTPLEPRPPQAVSDAPLEGDSQDAWSIVVQRLRVESLDEVSLGGYRLTGAMRLEGALEVQSGRRLELRPSTFAVDEGQLRHGEARVAKGLVGQGHFALGPLDAGAVAGLEALASLSGQLTLRGRVEDPSLLAELPALPLAIAFEGGQGPASLDLAFEAGALVPGSKVEWQAGPLKVSGGGYQTSGPLGLVAEVVERPEEGGSNLRVRLGGGPVVLKRADRPPLLQARAYQAELWLPNLDFGRIAALPEALGRAFDEWPVALSLQQVIAQGEEATLQWWVQAARTQCTLRLGALRDRQVHFRELNAAEVRAHLRPRRIPLEAAAGYLAMLPPMPALPAPTRGERPVRTAGPRWSMRVEQASADPLLELWVEAYRFRGGVSGRGGFEVGADGVLRAGPVRSAFNGGELHVGPWKAATALAGNLESSLSGVDLDEVAGAAFLRHLSSRGRLRGELAELAFLQHFPELPVPAQIAGGQGPFEAEVGIASGQVLPGSRLSWRSDKVSAELKGFRSVGPLRAEARVTARSGELRTVVEAEVSPYQVLPAGGGKPVVTGQSFQARLEGPRFDLARPSPPDRVRLRAPEGVVPDLRAVNAYIPREIPLRVESGAGRFSGSVHWTIGRPATAQLEIGGQQGALSYRRVQIRGDWLLTAELRELDLQTADARLGPSTLRLDNMAVRDGASARDSWFGRVEVKEGRLTPKGPVLLEAELETTLRDGRPLVSLFAAETELLPAWARSVVSLQALRAVAKVRLGESLWVLEQMRGRGQSLELEGRFRKAGAQERGQLLVTAARQRVGLSLEGGKLELKLLDAADWYRARVAADPW